MNDHSVTYRFRLRNLPHIIRMRTIFRVMAKRLNDTSAYEIADVGCSNGYITGQIAKKYGLSRVVGYDCEDENLQLGRQKYGSVDFRHLNLNEQQDIPHQYDVVTCFETLEHVGNLRNAVSQLLNLKKENGYLLITVPVEVGFWGIAKFVAKTLIYKYKLDELGQNPDVKRKYLMSLLKGERISVYRDNRERWGTHFGFDHRELEGILAEMRAVYSVKTVFTTKFYEIS